MWKAHQRGHDVYAMDVGNFSFRYNSPLAVQCTYVPGKGKLGSAKEYLTKLKEKGKSKKLTSQEIDVLLLRNNPTEEGSGRYWAEHAGVAFGRMMQQEGVLVLNDAYSLSNAFIDKLYFEELPADIKPKSIITRDKDELMAFYEENKCNIVLKPLEGSGGQDVYRIDKHEKNTNQIIDTIRQQGYIIAQEFLPEVKNGDVRVILMNGRILEEDGNYAIIRRVSGEGEFRSNFSLGATADKAPLTEAMQRIVDLTAPKLIRDGLFLVGLDIVDDKLIELNVLSPGGLQQMSLIDLPDFSTPVIEAIERKAYYKKMYKNQIPNKVLATMI
jgi:glutathione synthase